MVIIYNLFSILEHWLIQPKMVCLQFFYVIFVVLLEFQTQTFYYTKRQPSAILDC